MLPRPPKSHGRQCTITLLRRPIADTTRDMCRQLKRAYDLLSVFNIAVPATLIEQYGVV